MKPNDILINPTLDLLKELDGNGMSVYYTLLDGKPVAVVYAMEEPPIEAYQYNLTMGRLAYLSAQRSFNKPYSEHERKTLSEWREKLHPDDTEY